ncbi:hypothetical protein O0L34_g10237 [Tuta absoluta]|nr:hypothetical protein O0L34_g10237 [Tuta absoluta]
MKLYTVLVTIAFLCIEKVTPRKHTVPFFKDEVKIPSLSVTRPDFYKQTIIDAIKNEINTKAYEACSRCNPANLANDCPSPPQGYFNACQKTSYAATYCCVQYQDPFIPCDSDNYCRSVTSCIPAYHSACTLVDDILPRGEYCVCVLDNPSQSRLQSPSDRVYPLVQVQALTDARNSRNNVRVRGGWGDCQSCVPKQNGADCKGFEFGVCVYYDDRFGFCCE